MIDPIQNPGIAHQLNQAHISKKAHEKRLSDERRDKDRHDELSKLSSSQPWWRVSKLYKLDRLSHKISEDIPEDNRVFAAIQAVIQSDGSIRNILQLILKRIGQLGIQTSDEAYKKADYLIAPFCPPLNINTFRRQFYISYLKIQKDQALGSWVIRAQEGDQATYRNLLHQLRLVLSDFFDRHYKGLFNIPVVSDEILILVDKALHTYTPSLSFFSWFFAIVKSKLLTVPGIKATHKTLVNRNVAVTESRLAHLSISHHPGGLQ